MEVWMARHSGFCYGVRRAVELAAAAPGQTGAPVLTLGPLIHNPQMIARLKEQGIDVTDSLAVPPGSTVVIRSHGVGPQIYREAETLGIKLLDATCPHVKKAQSAARAFAEEGRQVIVAGERNHPEVQSILAWAGPDAVAVETAADVAGLALERTVGLVSQTTLERAVLEGIESALRERGTDLRVNPTICSATQERQQAAVELAGKVEAMVVVGGRNSANTRHLAEVCRKAGVPAYPVEVASEIDPAWFKGVRRVGITAGASTPDWIIEEVKQRMETMKQADLGSRDRLEKGAVLAGKVVGINKDLVFVDIGQKAEGVIALSELAWPVPQDAREAVSVGQLLSVLVLDPETADGSVQLSKVQADRLLAWDRMEDAMKESQPVEVTVTAAVKGGLSLGVHGVRCFMPASQIESSFVEDLTSYVGRTLEALPIEVDREKQKAVFSRRALLDNQRRAAETAALENLAAGQVLSGEVKRLASYGAFIDLGGVEGLLHVSEMSWHRIKDAAELLKAGDTVTVQVLKVDREQRKVSLGMKQLQQDPWHSAVTEFAEGTTVNGKVTRTSKFGAFVELAPGVEGLVHISELSDRRVATADEVVRAGQTVPVKVLKVDPAAKRISLSMIQAQEEAERKEFAPYLGQQSPLGATIGDKLGHLFKNRES